MRYETAIPVGRGAVGEVFKAWDPKLQRYVALKVLHRIDIDSRRRILREAQAQARVDHPHVCRVYDVGEDEKGRSYIAMQFVEGAPLDEVAAGLSIEERIGLVEIVCDAVQAAHSVGLIHRDLKPANIIVERRADGELVPFVVDFGIARERAEIGMTETGQVLGTPSFMSPEQARGEVRELDRRSDVYSLGSILYHLLAGHPPFSAVGGVQLMVKLLQEEPMPLRRTVAGIPVDLETIVMKCLEKDPDRRYGSARALADDLRRYLDGHTISGRRTGVVERLRRRARLHPAVTLLLALIGVGVPLGLAKYTLDLRAERAQAIAARADAEDLMELMLQDIYTGLEPLGRLDLLERVSSRSVAYYEGRREEELSAEAGRRRARTFRNMGEVLVAQGLHDEAEPALERYHALASARADAAPDDPARRVDLSHSLVLLAKIDQGRGRLDRAEERSRRAVEISRRLSSLHPASPEVRTAWWESLAQLGWCLRERRETAEAETVLTTALDLARQRVAHRPTDRTRHDLSVSLAYLGLLRSEAGDLDAARTLFVEALAIARELAAAAPGHHERSSEVQLDLNRLAYTELARGDVATARALYHEAVEVGERLVARDPRHARWARELAFSYSELAYIARQAEHWDAALAAMDRSLAISRRLYELDPTHASVVSDLVWDVMEVGRIRHSMGDEEIARQLWEEALGLIEPISGESGQDYYVSMHAQLLLLLGRPEEAAPLVQRIRRSGLEDEDLEELAARFEL